MPPPIDTQTTPIDTQSDPVYQAMVGRQQLAQPAIAYRAPLSRSPELDTAAIEELAKMIGRSQPILGPGDPGNPTTDYRSANPNFNPMAEALKAYNQLLGQQGQYQLGAADIGIRQQAENRLAELSRGQLANETARTQWQTSMHPAIQQLAQAGVNLATMSPEDRARLAHGLGDFSAELQRAMPVNGMAALAAAGRQPPTTASISQPTTPQGPSVAAAPLYDKDFENITALMSAYKADPFTALMQARIKNPQYFEANRQRLVDYALSQDKDNLNRLRQGVFRTGYRQLGDVIGRAFSGSKSPEEEFADYMRQAYGYGRSPMGIENVANMLIPSMMGGR